MAAFVYHSSYCHSIVSLSRQKNNLVKWQCYISSHFGWWEITWLCQSDSHSAVRHWPGELLAVQSQARVCGMWPQTRLSLVSPDLSWPLIGQCWPRFHHRPPVARASTPPIPPMAPILGPGPIPAPTQSASSPHHWGAVMTKITKWWYKRMLAMARSAGYFFVVASILSCWQRTTTQYLKIKAIYVFLFVWFSEQIGKNSPDSRAFPFRQSDTINIKLSTFTKNTTHMICILSFWSPGCLRGRKTHQD